MIMSKGDVDLVGLAETFGDVARALAEQDDVNETLDKIVHMAVDTLESCEYAGVSMIENRKITSPASTGDLPRTVDVIQSEVDEGPCLDAIKEHEVFQTGDLLADERWPQFATRAHEETGITSILSLRLFIEEDTMGALNLYSSAADAFDETDVALASVFAAHAAVAVSAANQQEHLERKAETRDLIGRAKGMLMAREGISDDQAFDLLRRASSRMHVKLTAVAEQVTSGEQRPSLNS
jgi:transcriptional regulator with GAF, ATPase, and Fis domain